MLFNVLMTEKENYKKKLISWDMIIITIAIISI